MKNFLVGFIIIIDLILETKTGSDLNLAMLKI